MTFKCCSGKEKINFGSFKSNSFVLWWLDNEHVCEMGLDINKTLVVCEKENCSFHFLFCLFS